MAIKPITNKHLVSKESVNRANEASTKSFEDELKTDEELQDSGLKRDKTYDDDNVIGLNIFVLPKINEKKILIDSIKFGFTYGIILYGVYDFTSASLLKKWNIKLALIDTFWGGIVYFLTCFFTIKIFRMFRHFSCDLRKPKESSWK